MYQVVIRGTDLRIKGFSPHESLEIWVSMSGRRHLNSIIIGDSFDFKHHEKLFYIKNYTLFYMIVNIKKTTSFARSTVLPLNPKNNRKEEIVFTEIKLTTLRLEVDGS